MIEIIDNILYRSHKEMAKKVGRNNSGCESHINVRHIKMSAYKWFIK